MKRSIEETVEESERKKENGSLDPVEVDLTKRIKIGGLSGPATCTFGLIPPPLPVEGTFGCVQPPPFTPGAFEGFRKEQKLGGATFKDRQTFFASALAEDIENRIIEFFGNMPLSEVMPHVKVAMNDAFDIFAKTNSNFIPFEEKLDAPIYVVSTVKDKSYIFTNLDFYSEVFMNLDGDFKKEAITKTYGPLDKEKLVKDTTAEQRSRIDDYFDFLTVMTKTHGAEFDIPASMSKIFKDFGNKKLSELTSFEKFLSQYIADTFNKRVEEEVKTRKEIEELKKK